MIKDCYSLDLWLLMCLNKTDPRENACGGAVVFDNTFMWNFDERQNKEH